MPGRSGFTIVVALLLCLLAASLARGQGLDYDILCSLQQSRTPAMDNAMQDLSNTLVLAPAVPVVLIASGWLADNADLRRMGTTAGVSLLMAFGITEGLKFTVRRPRPYLAYPGDLEYATRPVRGYSFPSGHTSLSFAVATSISLEYPKWYVVAPAMLWATGVGFSRLYLGVHNPTDVLAGAVVGAGSALIVHLIAQRMADDSPVPAAKGFVIPVSISF